jgi:hypothetical protein
MYDCSKINRLTIMYTSEGPGHYAGEKTKILEKDDARAICEEANRLGISIEMVLKSRESVESVVINTVLPFPSPEPAAKPEEKKEDAPDAGNREPPKDKSPPEKEEKQTA